MPVTQTMLSNGRDTLRSRARAVRWAARWSSIIGAVLGLAVMSAAWSAQAEPVKGSGSARSSEWKKGGTQAKARSRALRRARMAALEAAIARSGDRRDRSAVKAVVKNGDAWTGAYRVLRENVSADEVSVEIEVEIDLGRLAKRVARVGASKKVDGARYRVDTLEVAEGCGGSADTVVGELTALGAVGTGDDAAALTLQVSCRGFGAVPHTLLHAGRVSVVAVAGEQTLASETSTGFGGDQGAAFGHALVQAVGSVAGSLKQHRKQRLMLRVESPLPAARIRRLQRRLADSLGGVRSAKLAGVDPDGAIRIAVEAAMDAQGLAKAIETLRLEDISITIVRMEGTDGLTIRLN